MNNARHIEQDSASERDEQWEAVRDAFAITVYGGGKFKLTGLSGTRYSGMILTSSKSLAEKKAFRVRCNMRVKGSGQHCGATIHVSLDKTLFKWQKMHKCQFRKAINENEEVKEGQGDDEDNDSHEIYSAAGLNNDGFNL